MCIVDDLCGGVLVVAVCRLVSVAVCFHCVLCVVRCVCCALFAVR